MGDADARHGSPWSASTFDGALDEACVSPPPPPVCHHHPPTSPPWIHPCTFRDEQGNTAQLLDAFPGDFEDISGDLHDISDSSDTEPFVDALAERGGALPSVAAIVEEGGELQPNRTAADKPTTSKPPTSQPPAVAPGMARLDSWEVFF